VFGNGIKGKKGRVERAAERGGKLG